MQVRKAYPLAIALAAVMASPLALAQSDNTSATSQGATARQPMTPLNSDISISTFNHLDTNHDGHVTLDEARADSSFNSRFGAMDADGNGYISQNELEGEASTGSAAMGSNGSTTTYGNADDSNYESGSSASDTTNSTSSDSSTSNDTSNDTSTPPQDQDADDDTTKTP